MCDPATLTIVAMGATGVAGGASAYSQYQEGVAQSKYYTYQQDQTRQAAELALKQGEQQSNLIQDQGKMQGKQLATDQARFNSSQRAAMASMGLTGVSAEDIINDTFSRQKMDELVLRNNADIKSWEVTEAAKNQNWTLNNEANLLGYAAKNAKRAGKRQAIGTLLGTASSVARLGL